MTARSAFSSLARSTGSVVVLTGAGISAESGVPTFRGPEGYWTVGSREYHPMELATHASFVRMPETLWAWYLYRRSACLAAQPNGAHQALVRLERHFGDRFKLITQNVDGLHLRAGQSALRTFQIHGNIESMRCGNDCTPRIYPLPPEIDTKWERGRAVEQAERELLVCPRCGRGARPHVLWFDETYDEELFHFESSLAAARTASLLIVIGTTGSTNLPLLVGNLAAQRGIPIVVVNPEPNPFTEMAEGTPHGEFIQGQAGQHVGPLVDELLAL